MRRFILPLAVLLTLSSGSIVLAQETSIASTTLSSIFPVAALGNCASKSECKAYCDIASHHEACYSYAEVHGLMTAAQASTARLIVQKKGPGACADKDSCQAYCSQFSNAQECKLFAQTHNLLPPLPREKPIITASSTESRAKIDQLLSQKPGPGSCTDRESCKTYCGDSAHAQECITFAKTNGLMSKDEADRAVKVITQGPSGCTGEACKSYCDDDSHAQECITFAKKQGLIDAVKAQELQDNTTLVGPGGCIGADQCRQYCSKIAHKDECMSFVKENALRGLNQNGGESDRIMSPTSMGSSTAGTSYADLMQKCKDHPEACANVRGLSPGAQPPQQNTSGQGNLPRPLPSNTKSAPLVTPSASATPLGTPPSSLGAAVITAFLQLFGN